MRLNSPQPFSVFLVAICCGVSLLFPWSVSALKGAEPDGPAARAVLSKSARGAFLGGDFSDLEKTADTLRSTKARFPEGVWKLPSFYDGLRPTFGDHDSPDWKAWFDQLDAWKTAFPDSPTQPVVRAESLVEYGWAARGSGYANTVTDEGWKLLRDRLGQAHAALDEAAKLPVRDPHWYYAMQHVALGEGWNHDRYEALFKQAVAAEPTYYHYYFARTSAELPRWGGGPDAWIDFAEEAARRDDPAEGLSIYARIFWSHAGSVGGSFQNPKIDWKRVRQGFRDIEKQYPDSNWNLNNFCRFACLAGDRETAHELFGRLGEAVSLPTWGSQAAFEGWRTWAETEQKASPLRANLAIPTDETLMVQAVAFAPDGKTLLTGSDDGTIRLWDLATQKIVWSQDLGDGPIASVAFSPDGKVFAVGTGDQSNSSTPGVVTLWDARTRGKITTLADRRGNVFALGFTPDGKTLAIVGGSLGDGSGGHKPFGEAALYDLEVKKLRPLAWADGGYPLTAVAISPDGQFLVTPKGHSMNCWSLAKGEFVTDYHTRVVHAEPVQAVAISSDSKLLVTGTAPGWMNQSGKGELRRWDMTVPGWPEVKIPAWTATPVGLLALAISPDRKWLATGGYDGSIQLWDMNTATITATLAGHHQRIGALTFAPDGKTLASGAADGTVKWWNVPGASRP